jgi:thiol-disulfide isomerase/thioredoxin
MRVRSFHPLLVAATAVLVLCAGTIRSVVAAPKTAPCAVCSVREGAGAEAVKATVKHEGKEYYFCSTKCRDEFAKNPSEFLKAAEPYPAPAFSLKDLSGKTVSLADYKGKVVLVDFWATFCGPCIKAMPKFQKLHDELGPKGFAVLGIATDEEGLPKVAPAVKKIKVQYPILISDEDTWKAYNVETLPSVFLIDRKGQVVKRFGGQTEPKTIEAEIRKLVGTSS